MGGGDEGGRTPYLNAASVALYQLSYVPRSWKRLDEQKSLSGFKRSDLISNFLVSLVTGRRSDNALKVGVPKGSRTPVAAVKGRSPRPLDDGDQQPNMI